MALPARDKKALLTLVEQAHLVYLLSRYPKKQVLDDAADVLRLENGLAGMRAAAKDLSASFRERHAAVPWDELAKKPDSPDLLWRRAKRIAPTVLRELMPTLEGEPEAAFFLRPEVPRAKATAKAAKTKKPARAGGGRRSENGKPSR
jgi:aryl carrier-like protein